MSEKPLIDKWKLYDMIGYKTYHPEVRRFHDSKAKIKNAIVQRRTSKSYASAKDALPDILTPGTVTWIVGPSYSLAEKEFRYIHDDLVINRGKIGLPKPTTCLTNHRSGNLYIKFPWGSIVEGKSADRPDGLLGEAVDVVIYAEAAEIQRGIRERYVAPTLNTKKGREIIATTPQMKAEWVMELWEKGFSEDFPNIESFKWDYRANPLYDLKEMEEARKLLGEDNPIFREQYLGEWVFYGGMVYPTYNPDLHVIEPFEIPTGWKVIRGIDFGHRDPFVCLGAAIGPNGEVYIFDEYYTREGKSIREHAQILKDRYKKYNVKDTVGDPSGKQAMEDLQYENIGIRSGNNDRQAGRLRLLEYFMPADDAPCPFPYQNSTKQYERKKWARIYIFSTCKELIRELKFYRWKEGRDIENEKEKTEGEDHACDALRYLIMTRPSPLRPKGNIIPGTFNSWMRTIRRAKEMVR